MPSHPSPHSDASSQSLPPHVEAEVRRIEASRRLLDDLESSPGTGCPETSKIGTVTVHTQLLSESLEGDVFVAQPYENPFPESGHPGGSLLALYVVIKNPQRGVMVKLAGKIEPDPKT
jgi:hypothetical protein